ncbi:MAG TPA: LPS-assembly protein LptD [Rickettsia endosymbiont of Diachasma alloeum]|nr:LPS-assembly protein LptD [Rickettsia endosymbiont of Diachasma alloeum]
MLRVIFLFIIVISPFFSFASSLTKSSGVKINNLIADFVEYNENEGLIYAKGNLKILTDEHLLTADNLLYDINNDILWVEGNVRVKDKDNRITLGDKAILKNEFKQGVVSKFIMLFNNNSLLVAKLAERIDENNIRLHYAKFTPCEVICSGNPLWQISAKNTDIHSAEHKIVYKNVFFEVYCIPVFYLPYFFHPTPSAPASSGLLVPDVKNGRFGVPIYLRAKPNMDFTLTPRVFNKDPIFELEGRYRPNNTDNISFDGSYGRLPYLLEKNGDKIKDKKISSYHYIVNGNFYSSDKVYNYGFKAERTSDKAYLKNYYNNYASYLTSRVFLNKIHKADYFQIEALTSQGLGSNDSRSNYPLVVPKITTKNVISLNDDESRHIVIENNTLMYKERIGKQLTRTSLQLSYIHNLITSSGQIFEFVARDRGDFYIAKQAYFERTRAAKTLQRNIPEFQTLWRYPFAGAITKTINVLIEPIVSFTIGRKLTSKDMKFVIIDPMKYELSGKNLFLSNRYSGIDCHDFGNRLNYGLNASFAKEQNYLRLFLGQSLNTRYSVYQKASNTENVGKISGNIYDNLELFYDFRKNRYFKPIRDEVGANLYYGRISLTGSLIQLTNLKKYYRAEAMQLSNNRARQFYGNVNYQLTDNWSIGIGGRIDLSKGSADLLTRTIRVTYAKDCVRIATKIYSDYVSDESRGIKKTKSLLTISVGLRVLNM